MTSTNNYVLAPNGAFYSEDELYHYGIKGMKWGQRKKYEAERNAYRQAKKDYRNASRETWKKSWTAIGRKGLKKYNSALDKQNEAELNMIEAKAKYKAAKSKNAEKAEFDVYRKAMGKTGLVGSAADDASKGRSTRIYNKLTVSKGKAYADAVEKRVEKQAVATLVGAAAVTVGAAVVQGIMMRN